MSTNRLAPRANASDAFEALQPLRSVYLNPSYQFPPPLFVQWHQVRQCLLCILLRMSPNATLFPLHAARLEAPWRTAEAPHVRDLSRAPLFSQRGAFQTFLRRRRRRRRRRRGRRRRCDRRRTRSERAGGRRRPEAHHLLCKCAIHCVCVACVRYKTGPLLCLRVGCSLTQFCPLPARAYIFRPCRSIPAWRAITARPIFSSPAKDSRCSTSNGIAARCTPRSAYATLRSGTHTGAARRALPTMFPSRLRPSE